MSSSVGVVSCKTLSVEHIRFSGDTILGERVPICELDLLKTRDAIREQSGNNLNRASVITLIEAYLDILGKAREYEKNVEYLRKEYDNKGKALGSIENALADLDRLHSSLCDVEHEFPLMDDNSPDKKKFKANIGLAFSQVKSIESSLNSARSNLEE